MIVSWYCGHHKVVKSYFPVLLAVDKFLPMPNQFQFTRSTIRCSYQTVFHNAIEKDTISVYPKNGLWSTATVSVERVFGILFGLSLHRKTWDWRCRGKCRHSRMYLHRLYHQRPALIIVGSHNNKTIMYGRPVYEVEPPCQCPITMNWTNGSPKFW